MDMLECCTYYHIRFRHGECVLRFIRGVLCQIDRVVIGIDITRHTKFSHLNQVSAYITRNNNLVILIGGSGIDSVIKFRIIHGLEYRITFHSNHWLPQC